MTGPVPNPVEEVGVNRAVLLSLFLLVAGACSEGPTSLLERDLPDPSFASASKWTLLHAQKVPLSNSQYWACVDEIVDFSGWYNVTVRQVVSNSGNTTFRLHVAGPPVKGVGRTSADRYVSPEITNLTEHTAGDGFVSTFQFRIRRISMGGAPNSVGWIKFHLTFNANGGLTAYKDEAVFDVCRG
jgi:hypothetical protein